MRTKAPIKAAWKAVDPIETFTKQVLANGVLDEDGLAALLKRVQDRNAKAGQRALRRHPACECPRSAAGAHEAFRRARPALHRESRNVRPGPPSGRRSTRIWAPRP